MQVTRWVGFLSNGLRNGGTMNAKDSTPDANAQAVTRSAASAADEAHLHQAIASVDWERRGWLGRLVRLERAPL
jgi:hypothetical protein